MSWVQVDFNLVRYSPIEATHYFFDPSYPDSIQFLLNDRWEPWNVAYVARNAKDPDVRRVAEDAEQRLNHGHPPDNHPASQRHLALENVNGYAPSPSGSTPLTSPINGHFPTSASRPFARDQSLSAGQPSPLSPGFPSPVHENRHYVSPYEPSGSGAHNYEPYPGPGPSKPHAAPLSPSSLDPSLAQAPATPQYNDEPPPIIPAANRETKILLSLDGDGVRGLSAVLLVESLVNAVCSKLGRRIDPYQMFDLIGGTSTGGILGIMLGRLRMRPHNAREAYIRLARTMYMDKRQFYQSLDPNVPQPQYNDAHETAIKETITSEGQDIDDAFTDTRQDSTHVFVVSTQVDIGVNRAAIIRSYPTRRLAGPEVDPDIKIWQAMKATSAAPRYVSSNDGLSRRNVIEPGLVDYGTAKNNPIKDLEYECRKLYSYANDTRIIVSIGTGSGYDRQRESQEMVNGIDVRSAKAQTTGEHFEEDNRNLIESGWMKYFRFNVPDLDDIPLEEWKEVNRIMEKTHAYLAIPEVGQRFYACVDAIAGLLLGEHQT